MTYTLVRYIRICGACSEAIKYCSQKFSGQTFFFLLAHPPFLPPPPQPKTIACSYFSLFRGKIGRQTFLKASSVFRSARKAAEPRKLFCVCLRSILVALSSGFERAPERHFLVAFPPLPPRSAPDARAEKRPDRVQ